MRYPFLLSLIMILGVSTGCFTPSFGSAPVDTAHYYMQHSYNVQKYSLNIDLYACYVAPYPKNYSATVVIDIRVDSILSSIQLNAMNTSLIIDSVRLAGVSFTHLNDILLVQLNRTYSPGELLSIKVCYHHLNIADQGFYASNGYAFTDFPPEGARKVLPCWDRPSDKALWDITAKVPVNVRLGSIGILADSTISADTIRYHWVSSDVSSTYLFTLTSKTNFLIQKSYWHYINNPNDSIPILLYYKSGENLSIINNLIGPITSFFSEKFGEYPFEKIGFATLSSLFPWGGMENQTMVNLQPGGYNDEDLIAHEHSHQWFGDMITCGTWADIWLNEGFGTYCQKLFVEHNSGYTAYKNQMNSIANNYLSNNPGIPIYNPIWAIQTPDPNLLYSTALTYNKAACVLFQLRYVVGDTVFFNIMNSYATDTNFMYKNAVTLDFIEKANLISGQDMNWFFNQWIYAPNHPKYENVYKIEDQGNGNWLVKFVIHQTQTNTLFFKMPVQIQVDFTDGSDSLIQVMNDENHQYFEFVFTKQPSNVIFDPFRNILLKNATLVVGTEPAPGSIKTGLSQNEPNPFSKTTQISYQVGTPSEVIISIFNNQGKLMDVPIQRYHEQGVFRFNYANDSLTPGIYFLRMNAGSFTETKKMVVF